MLNWLLATVASSCCPFSFTTLKLLLFRLHLLATCIIEMCRAMKNRSNQHGSAHNGVNIHSNFQTEDSGQKKVRLTAWMKIKTKNQRKATLNKYYVNECYVNFRRTINVFFINRNRPTEEINGRKNEPQPLIAVWLSNRSLEK